MPEEQTRQPLFLLLNYFLVKSEDMELNTTTTIIAPDSRMIATMKTETTIDRQRLRIVAKTMGQGTTFTATRTRRIISRRIRTTRLLAISLRIGTTTQSGDTPRTETSTPGIALTIPETGTTALETKTMQERTTTSHNLLSKVEKVLQ
jgi:hypothetical protein